MKWENPAVAERSDVEALCVLPRGWPRPPQPGTPPVANPPRYTAGLPSLSYAGERYLRYSAGAAETRYVIGEFTWKVSVGEIWQTIDFIAAPKMLSRETSRNETTWSLGEYLPPAEVAAAFKL